MSKKITPKELQELQARTHLVNNKKFELHIIENEFNIFVSALLKQHGKKDGEKYNIDLGTGEITKTPKTDTTPKT